MAYAPFSGFPKILLPQTIGFPNDHKPFWMIFEIPHDFGKLHVWGIPMSDPFLLGDQCNRLHNRPTMSQTLLLSHMCFGHAVRLLSCLVLSVCQRSRDWSHLHTGFYKWDASVVVSPSEFSPTMWACCLSIQCVPETKPKGTRKRLGFQFESTACFYTMSCIRYSLSLKSWPTQGNIETLYLISSWFSGLLRQQLNFAQCSIFSVHVIWWFSWCCWWQWWCWWLWWLCLHTLPRALFLFVSKSC